MKIFGFMNRKNILCRKMQITSIDSNSEDKIENDIAPNYRQSKLSKERSHLIKINLLNVQGLTQAKLVEIEESITNQNIFFLTETHNTRKRVYLKSNNTCIEKMRKVDDKKGGGLMVVWERSKEIIITEIETHHVDIILIKLCTKNSIIYILTVYMATNDNSNENILKEIKSIIVKFDDQELLIIGDFNGQIGFLGPQIFNRNGKNVLDLINKYDLILMNSDPICIGEITREQADSRSAIDFVLSNTRIHKKIESILIDESWSGLKISDHNVTTIEINIGILNKIKVFKEHESITFLKINDITKERFKNSMIESIRLNENNEIDRIENLVSINSTAHMKVTIKRKVNSENV